MTQFILYAPPRGKSRPRFARSGRCYTPKKDREYERKIVAAAKIANAELIEEGPVAMHLEVGFAYPKYRWRKRKPLDATWHAQKCDLDNVVKIVADALNGVCYTDDSQIAKLYAQKMWVPQGEDPFVLVKVWAIR